MAAGPTAVRPGRRVADRGRHDGDRPLVQGQGAEPGVRAEPHHLAARVARRAGLAELGRFRLRLLDGAAGALRSGSAPSASSARRSTGCSSRTPPAATRWARRARPTRSCSPTSGDSASRTGSSSLLCVTFYSGIFPFQTFAQKYFIDARGTSPELASWLVGMLTTFAMFGTPAFGALVDRIGPPGVADVRGRGAADSRLRPDWLHQRLAVRARWR